MIRWIERVVRQRLTADGTTLRGVTDSAAWLGDIQTREITPYDQFKGAKEEANWLPDEASARAWRELVSTPK